MIWAIRRWVGVMVRLYRKQWDWYWHTYRPAYKARMRELRERR